MTRVTETDDHEEAQDQIEEAFIRGMAAGQAAMPKGTLTVIDSPETMLLRNRLVELEAALLAAEAMAEVLAEILDYGETFKTMDAGREALAAYRKATGETE